MNSRADTLFLEALQVPPGAEREAFLAEACKEDADLRQRVEALLADDTAAEAFFDAAATVPTPAEGATMVTPSGRSSFTGEKPGDTIGRFKLLQIIGEGGFGVVYLAEQREPVKRRVALKILKPGMDTREVVARFESERQALALMDHPNIARVFDGGATESGRPYFVMELVKGVPSPNTATTTNSPPASGSTSSSMCSPPSSTRTKRASDTATSSPPTSSSLRTTAAGRQSH